MLRVFVRFNRLAAGRNVYGPDEMAMDADDNATLQDLLTVLWNARFLPEVKAYRVAWVALHAGRPLALLARGLRSPILFTGGKTLLRDYAHEGGPVFFMADLGRQDSRAVLESFGRRVREGADASGAMNDVLESYLMINRLFGSALKVSVRARGEAECRRFPLHASARLSDAVCCVYRAGCLPEKLSGGPVWILGGRPGALAVLCRGWEAGAEARYLAGQDAGLSSLFEEQEEISLELVPYGAGDPEAAYEALKNKTEGGYFGWNGYGNGFNERFHR